MKVKELMQETVIDARDKFGARRTRADVERLDKEIPHSMKSGWDSPARTERGKITNAIEQLQQDFENKLKKYKMELAPVLNSFPMKVTIRELIGYNSHRDPDGGHKEVRAFVNAHYDEIRAAVDEYEKGLDDLYNMLQQQKERHGLEALKNAKREVKYQLRTAVKQLKKA